MPARQGIDGVARLMFLGEGSEHYEVLCYPVREMQGATVVAIADEFAAITHTLAWRRKFRRSVKPGDRLHMGRRTDVRKYVYTSGLDGEPLDVWPHLGIEEL